MTDQAIETIDAGERNGVAGATRADRSACRRDWCRVLAYVDGVPEELLERLWSDPDGVVADAEMLKDGDRVTVVRIDADHHRFVLKRYNLRSWWHTARHLLIRSRAKWNWVNSARLRSAGIRSPRARAFLEERQGALRGRSFLLCDYVEGRTLRDLYRDGPYDDARLDRIAAAFAEIWRVLGAMRIGHDDMKDTNFIVDREDRIWLVDLDGMRVHWLPPRFRHQRDQDYDRFMRNWQHREEVAAIFRDRIDR